MNDEQRELLDSVNNAFEELVNHGGLLARANAACCSGCSMAELEPVALEYEKPGYVYYHSQDLEQVVDYPNNPALFLRFVGLDTKMTNGLDTLSVGKMLYRALKRQQLEIDWNGTASQAIKVTLKEV
jgi:hypothetical protein